MKEWAKLLLWVAFCVGIFFAGDLYVDYLKWRGVPSHAARSITTGVYFTFALVLLYDLDRYLTPFRKTGTLSS